jgi:glutamate decarboxylase
MPPKVEDLAVLRIVIREGFSRDMADMLLTDLKWAIEHFESQPGYKPAVQEKTSKAHKIC